MPELAVRSGATLVAIGPPFQPVKTTQFAVLRTFSDSPDSRARFLARAYRASRHPAPHLPPMTRDYHLLPALYQVQQLAQYFLCLEDTDGAQNSLNAGRGGRRNRH